MNEAFERFDNVDHDPLDITAKEIVNLLDVGLSRTEIDRMRFTRWRLRSHQLDGDGWLRSDSDELEEGSSQDWPFGHRTSH